jgi:hypothetical protein
VPEAAVHEDAQFARGKDDIWTPGQIPPVNTETQTDRMQVPSHRKLGLRIPAANLRHNLTAPLCRYRIHTLPPLEFALGLPGDDLSIGSAMAMHTLVFLFTAQAVLNDSFRIKFRRAKLSYTKHSASPH